ncbi:RB1-inducible coiled-coil protein 1 [Pseudolycoriella hygida]|uniref:RB1-inducible coiled-coil protein 1 n=1 Tax=Pseudolycoriella hygida TaxID=35572 RepID=A0A9Q0NF18_9DIPT|nr:RB1-inducible coiled-coil protein 1 [Pseudolycoriella hygida]
MLYIFHVDTGHMMKFDMSYALESVENLKKAIERVNGLSVKNQVLLISGGEILQDGCKVCSYSSGTDTNPIYVFSTAFSDVKPLAPSIEVEDFKEKVARSLRLPANYTTVNTRCQLAQKMYEHACNEYKICEKLVFEQHLQQQGWAAVMANMEDVTDEFRQRFEDFSRSFDQHLLRQTDYNDFLESFSEDLSKLSRLPILPGLMFDAQRGFHGFDDILSENESFSISGSDGKRSRTNSVRQDTEEEPPYNDVEISEQQKVRGLTLLNWMTKKENEATLLSVAESCRKGLKLFQGDEISLLKSGIDRIIAAAIQEDMKEIKGLKSRLEGLDRLMFDAKKILQDQNELATAFQQNQTRASDLGDASILPDLCESHSSQLSVMLKNHLEICDIRRRVSTAKDELGINLVQRLKFIVQIENRMSDLDNQLLFYHRCLRRVQRHLIIVEQIHYAPTMFINAVSEVVRRRQFSTHFLLWASNLSSRLASIYADENMKRQDFNSSFEGHFLSTLFSGMEDFSPSSFATEMPAEFDIELPNLTQNDVDVLSTCLPEVASNVTSPDISAVIQFFMQASGNSIQTGTDKNTLEKTQVKDFLSNVKDGCDSETDTEEFEQLGALEKRQASTSTTDVMQLPETSTMSTSTSTVCMKNVETITEVRTHISHIENSHVKRPLSYYSIHSSSMNKTNPPKKPPRLSNKPTSTSQKPMPDSLPSIPEIHSPETIEKKCIPQSSDTSSSDDISFTTGHHNNCQYTMTSNIYPQKRDLCDGEFIHSEFYIDESLPSSLGSDPQDDLRLLKYDSSSDDLRQCDGENKNSNLCIEQLNYHCDDANGAVIHLLQENLGSTRLEVERLRGLLHSMHNLCQNSVSLLREQLANMKRDSASGKQSLEQQFEKIAETWDKMKDETQNREREAINRLTVDHELELNDIKKYLNTKIEEINTLTIAKDRLEELNQRLIAEQQKDKELSQKVMDEMNNYVVKLEARTNVEKEKAVNDIRDKLVREHKTEIESLRCRFKLMANMDRSPSDTSLEKIDRNDAIDIHGSTPKYPFGTVSPRSPTSSQDMFKKILDEKERQLDALRERLNTVTRENEIMKKTILSLAESDEASRQISKLGSQIEALQMDKRQLELELSVERTKREMEASVTLDRSSLATSNRELVSPSSSSFRTKSNCPRHFICIDSCTRGDHVLIVWNGSHRQFTIVQEAPVLYFLHAESHEALNLVIPLENEPALSHTIGIVTDKEYCHAKKNENRYKVSVGTKFYRVKVRPRSPAKCEGKCCPKRERHEAEKSLQQSAPPPAVPQNLIDSFAQTDAIENKNLANRDMVDSGLSIHTRSYKERNISITEEDERSNYVSATVEEENQCTNHQNEDQKAPNVPICIVSSEDSGDKLLNETTET